MLLALRICKASKPAGIVFYFKGLATQQMRKDNDKQYQNLGYAKQARNICITQYICTLGSNIVICGEFFGCKRSAARLVPRASMGTGRFFERR